MQPRRKDEQLAQESRFKNRIIWFLLLMVTLSLYKFATYPESIPVYTAPDISRAFLQKSGDVPNETVYGFARTLWESINFCKKDCMTEFPQALEQYRAFLTSACYTDLRTRYERQSNLYEARSRRLLPTENAISDLGKTQRISRDLWHVVLEYQLDDDVGGVTTRNQTMQYPLKIVHNTVPTQYNPWGLAIDCYWEEPRAIAYDKEKLESSR